MSNNKKITVDDAAQMLRDADDEKIAMNALLGATIEILGTELFVTLAIKGENKFTLLLKPSKASKAPEKSINDLLTSVKSFFGKNMEVDMTALDSIIPNNGENPDVKISLSMAFLFIEYADENYNVEYAFQLNANLEEVVPAEIKNIINIKNLQLAVWNTTRKKIVDAMNIVNPDDYIKEMSE